jgi:hypothetical protein
MIKTQSGMQLLFDETPGKENLLLQDKKGSTIKMDSVNGSVEIKTENARIQIAKKTITVKDSKENQIDMNENEFKVTSKVPFKIDASGQPVEIIGNTIDFNKG